MNAFDLPTSLTIGGVGHPIRYGWRNILNIFSAMNDPNMDAEMKSEVILESFYPNWIHIPYEHIPEALEKACEFMDCGYEKDDVKRPRLVDWEQDAAVIIPAVNAVANREIRLDPNIHWWTFHGWYMAIEGGLFSTVLRIRQKQAKGKKLDKCEEEFFSENKRLVELQRPQTAEEKAMQDYFDKWLK